MKIAFWSEDRQSGTTSNMLASAAMMSILCPKIAISMQSLGTSGKPLKDKPAIFEAADIYFLDCGNGLDVGRRRVLQQMDMVVVNLKQEKEALDRFFLEDMHVMPNFLLLLGNYYGSSVYNRDYLARVYRIAPEKVGAVYGNSEFSRAYELGRLEPFVKREHIRAQSVRNELLLKELEQFSKQLIKKYEEQNQGGTLIWNR